MSDAVAHIDAWLAAGLIDRATAERLRAAAPGAPPADSDGTVAAVVAPAAIGAPEARVSGPTMTVAEVFGYLGGAFLLAAWFALFGRVASDGSDPELVLAVGSGIAAGVMAALGAVLRSGVARSRRAAGVAFVVAVFNAGAAATSVAVAAGLDWPIVVVVGTATALVVAIGLRAAHPAMLTQFGLLVALTSTAGAVLSWVQSIVFPNRGFLGLEIESPRDTDPLILVVGSAGWWLACAVLIGFLGLRESRSTADDGHDDAARRASMTRLWAGFVAVGGLQTAIGLSGYDADGSYGRILEPWVGDLGLLIVSVALIERAFNREATSYVYAAALGLILALTDFNFTYLSGSTESGLALEGLILLGAGLGADRLRRRVAAAGRPPTDAPPPAGFGGSDTAAPGPG
jgi:hypothetical protein